MYTILSHMLLTEDKRNIANVLADIAAELGKISRSIGRLSGARDRSGAIHRKYLRTSQSRSPSPSPSPSPARKSKKKSATSPKALAS